jgi:hypothetical protein
MQPVGFLRPRRIGTATAVVAVLWGAAPVHAQAPASTPTLAAVLDSSACTFSSVSIVTGTPVQAVPSASGAVTLSVAGAGSCEGASGTQSFSVAGNAPTVGPSSCASLASAGGSGLLSIGGHTYSVSLYIGGPTASPEFAMVVTDASTIGSGLAQLSITPASLQACLQPGGTTSLNYTGTVLFAF